MSRFDDDLRRAVAPIAGEPLPDVVLDEALDAPPSRPRWPGLAGAATAVLLVAVVAGIGLWEVLPSPSIDPSPSPDPSPVAVDRPVGITATEETLGIRLTLTLDRESAEPGQRVWADVTIENVGSQVVTWSHGGGVGCEHPAGVHVIAPDGVEIEYGREDWTGWSSDLKRRMVRDVEPGNYGFQPPERLGQLSWGCYMSRTYEVVDPGDVLRYRAAWDTATWQGMPMRPGEFIIEASFHIDGRGEIDSTGSRPDIDEPHRVSVPFMVTGPDIDWISPGLAMDAILADAGFQDEAGSIEVAGGHKLKFVDGVWILHVYSGHPDFESGRPVEAVVARVDGRTGELLDVTRDPDVDPLYPVPPLTTDPTPPPPEPVTASVEQHGIRLSLTLDQAAATAGTRVWADVTVENIGTDVVHWSHSGSCAYASSVSVRAEEPFDVDFGSDDWMGDLQILKGATVDEREGSTFAFTPEEWVDFEGLWGCTSNLVPDEVPAGGVLTYRAAWDVGTRQGMPVPPGDYEVEARFRFDSRGDPPTGDEPDTSLRVSLPFSVVGTDFAWFSPGLVMDQLLADERFLDQLRLAPRGRWRSQDLRLVDGEWVFHLYLTETDADSEVVGAIVARVEPRHGDVLMVELDPDARPPGE
jgi:hypothetical protein